MSNPNQHLNAYIWGLVGTLIIVFVVWLIAGQTLSYAQDISSTNIEEQMVVSADNIKITLSSSGVLEPIREVSLSFRTSGKVKEILVEEGQYVGEGQVIAILDADNLSDVLIDAELTANYRQIELSALFEEPLAEERALAEAELLAAQLSYGGNTALSGEGSIDAQINALEIELAKNQTWQSALSRDTAYASLSSAAVNLETTIDRLHGETTTEYYNAIDARDDAQANYMKSESTLMAQGNNVVEAEADYIAESNRPTDYGGSNAIVQETQATIDLTNLSQADVTTLMYRQIDHALANLEVAGAELQLEDAVIRAPFSGMVITHNLVVGEVPPVDAVTLADTTQYVAPLAIDEVDIVAIEVGQQVQLELDALPDVILNGVVNRIAITPDVTDNLVTYDVEVIIENPDEQVRSGMSSTAMITIEEHHDVIVVPNRFITTIEQAGIRIINTLNADGSIVSNRVTVGIQTGTSSQVLSGINIGDTIVILSEDSATNALGGRPTTFGGGQ